jgi:hypothetical protein
MCSYGVIMEAAYGIQVKECVCPKCENNGRTFCSNVQFDNEENCCTFLKCKILNSPSYLFSFFSPESFVYQKRVDILSIIK